MQGRILVSAVTLLETGTGANRDTRRAVEERPDPCSRALAVVAQEEKAVVRPGREVADGDGCASALCIRSLPVVVSSCYTCTSQVVDFCVTN